MTQPEGLRMYEDFIDEGEERQLLDYINKQPWSSVLKRRVQHYGAAYQYRNAAAPSQVPPVPQELYQLVKRILGERVWPKDKTQVIVNEYKPGQGIGPHVDDPRQFGGEIVGVSLGANVFMKFQTSHSDSISIPLFARSAYVMSGPARYDWKHSLRNDGDKTRVSITFRELNP